VTLLALVVQWARHELGREVEVKKARAQEAVPSRMSILRGPPDSPHSLLFVLTVILPVITHDHDAYPFTIHVWTLWRLRHNSGFGSHKLARAAARTFSNLPPAPGRNALHVSSFPNVRLCS
jgi:hypothetical protein